MIDIGTPARKAFFDALKGQVMVEDIEIPIVDEKLDDRITSHDMFILIGAQNEQDRSNKTLFVGEVDLVLTVYNRTKATATKTKIEAIASQILTIVFPTRTTYGVFVSDPYHLTSVRSTDKDYAFEKADQGFEIAKRMTFRMRITQS
ncbi:hypothetical protein [Paraflavitalea pollutisoli]|uniref:hypothetical protein n=1 Tax=Paraflavitalea pollutisoli TaxID=3034143 RepID=UPI0023EC98A3|nr:hypothetical protein [Paraflavitalea sp. H1-2-19X]